MLKIIQSYERRGGNLKGNGRPAKCSRGLNKVVECVGGKESEGGACKRTKEAYEDFGN